MLSGNDVKASTAVSITFGLDQGGKTLTQSVSNAPETLTATEVNTYATAVQTNDFYRVDRGALTGLAVDKLNKSTLRQTLSKVLVDNTQASTDD